MNILRTIVFFGIASCVASAAWAQQVGNGVGAEAGGLTQTGQITSSAAIQRDPNAFVGASSDNFLSRSATSGVTGRGTAGTGGLTGIGGLAGSLATANAFGRGVGGGFGGGFGGGGFGGGGFGQGGFNNPANAAGATQQLRIPVRIGFTARRTAPAVLMARFSQRLTSLPALNLSTPVAVKMEGRTAVLQGTVADAHQKSLIGRLVNLEPGVSSVRNELTIAPQ